MLILGLLFLFIGGYMALPRAVRSNNPLNIRISDRNDWDGELPAALNKAVDSSFESFYRPSSGYRAATILIRNYQRKYGLNTVKSIIERFAPPTNDAGEFENHTDSYIKSISSDLGVSPTQSINLYDDEFMANMLVAMHKIEAGAVWFGKRLAMAGVEQANRAHA